MAIPTTISKTPKAKTDKPKAVKPIKPVDPAKVTKDNPNGLSQESLDFCKKLEERNAGPVSEPVSPIFKGTALDPSVEKPVKEKKPRAPKAEVVATPSSEKALAAQAKRYETELKDLRKAHEADLKDLSKRHDDILKDAGKQHNAALKVALANYNDLLKKNEQDAKALDKTIEAARKQAEKDAKEQAKQRDAAITAARKEGIAQGRLDATKELEARSKNLYQDGFTAAVKAAITAVKGL